MPMAPQSLHNLKFSLKCS